MVPRAETQEARRMMIGLQDQQATQAATLRGYLQTTIVTAMPMTTALATAATIPQAGAPVIRAAAVPIQAPLVQIAAVVLIECCRSCS